MNFYFEMAINILEVTTFPMFICAMAIVNYNKKIVK